MDEYLFLTVAKLKADRMRLTREQTRAIGSVEPDPDLEEARPKSSSEAEFLPFLNWREQS